MKYITTRNVGPDECSWLTGPIPVGTSVYSDGIVYWGMQYVSFSDSEDDVYFLFPYNALANVSGLIIDNTPSPNDRANDEVAEDEKIVSAIRLLIYALTGQSPGSPEQFEAIRAFMDLVKS